MKGKTILTLMTVGGIAAASCGEVIRNKVKNIKTDIKVAKTKNELNEKLVETQKMYIDELEKKLKKMESK